MTITVTNIDQGPFVSTGEEQSVAYTFMTLTDREIIVSYSVDGPARVVVDRDLYNVTRNRSFDGFPIEGGAVVVEADAIPAGADFWLTADPFFTRDMVWSNNGSLLRNLNDENDRQVLRLLVQQNEVLRILGIAGNLEEASAAAQAAAVAAEASAQIASEGAAAVENKADKDGDNIDNPDAFRAAILAEKEGLYFTNIGPGTAARSLYLTGEETISLYDFAVYDPVSATATTSALQLAIDNSAATGRAVMLPPAISLNGPLVIPSGVRLSGITGTQTSISAAGAYDLFTLQGSEISISDIVINDTGKTSGWDFVLSTGASGGIERLTFDRIFSIQSKGMIKDGGSGVTNIVKLKDFYARQLQGPMLAFTRSFAYLELEDVTADFNGAGSAGNHKAFSIDGTALGSGSGGGVFKTVHVLGDASSGNTGQIGFHFKGYKAAWFQDAITADSCAGKGYIFEDCIKLRGEIEASLNNGVGFEFLGCVGVDMRLNGQGRNGLSGAAASVPLIRFGGGSNAAINLRLGNVVDPTGHIIDVAGSQAGAINIDGGIASGAGGRAISAAGSSVIQWTGFSMGGNAGGNYDLGAPVQYLEGVFASGGRTGVAGPGTG